MAFFAPEPEPTGDAPPRPVYRSRGPWEPDNGVLPGEAAIERVIARGPQTAIALGRVTAYPNGFGLVVVILHPVERGELDAFGHAHDPRHARPGRLRFGLRFADGRQADNDPGPPVERDGVTMNFGGGGGGPARMDVHGFVSPLPPPGSLVVAASWPDAGVPEAMIELDAAVILDAAARAQVVFDLPEQPPPPAGATGWDAYR